MMHDATCIFCKIITGVVPSKKIAENEHVLVIQDIAPKAPIHYLIMPKSHIADIASLHKDDDRDTMAALLAMAAELKTTLPGTQSFRLLSNNGFEAGQRVFHLHFHFLSGKQMTDF